MTASASAPERVLQRLDWTVVRRLDGLLQGDYRSLFRGNGVDFADLREYEYGDDIRHIDWNVTARMDTPYIREFLEDREITAWFLLDLSPSVDFGTAESERLKRSVLVDFVTTLARVLTRHGNRVGAVFYGSRVGADDPGARRPGPGAAAHQRPARRTRGSRRAPFTDLAPLLEAGQRWIKGRVARVRHLGLHQRAGLGAAARAADPAARGASPSGCTTGARSSCPTSGRCSWTTPRPASSSTSTPTTRASGGGSRRRRSGARPTLRAAFRRAGVDAVSLVDRRRPGRAIVRMAAQRAAAARR